MVEPASIHDWAQASTMACLLAVTTLMLARALQEETSAEAVEEGPLG